MTRLIVVGAGLSGLMAAILAAERGYDTTLVAEGRGGLSYSSGAIDIWHGPSPAIAVSRLKPPHPYALAGYPALRKGSAAFRRLAAEAGIPYAGSLANTIPLPTALGGIHRTCLLPASQRLPVNWRANRVCLGEVPSLRDFAPAYLGRNLRQQGVSDIRIVSLPLPFSTRQFDGFATEFARAFDRQPSAEESARLWRPLLRGAHTFLVPAILGLDRHIPFWESLAQLLDVAVVEIPTLPPSVPGIRLENALRRLARARDVTMIEGAHALARVGAHGSQPSIIGVSLRSVNRPMVLDADALILATGGIMHGGLAATMRGTIRESVLDLPVRSTPGRSRWTAASVLDPQPFSRFGVIVNENMQPVSSSGHLLFPNLFAIGGLLSDADRIAEASRQGIDLATAYRAVEALSEMYPID